jgi:hypothetical protein
MTDHACGVAVCEMLCAVGALFWSGARWLQLVIHKKSNYFLMAMSATNFLDFSESVATLGFSVRWNCESWTTRVEPWDALGREASTR